MIIESLVGLNVLKGTPLIKKIVQDFNYIYAFANDNPPILVMFGVLLAFLLFLVTISLMARYRWPIWFSDFIDRRKVTREFRNQSERVRLWTSGVLLLVLILIMLADMGGFFQGSWVIL